MKSKVVANRTSFIRSLKSISEDCQSLYFSTTPNREKSLPSELDLSKKSIPLTTNRKIYHPSTARSLTLRKIPQPRPFSALTRRSKSVLSQNTNVQICRKVYRKKIEQSKLKQNQKQQSLFVQKLANSIKGKTANLASYEIGPNCMKQLSSFLDLYDVAQLVLDKNPIGDSGLKELEKILQNMSLQTLSLGSVCMHEAGCDSLLLVLGQIKTLECLNICSYQGSYRNRLHNQGIKNIDKVIKNGLKKLNLSNTGINDQNFGYLCQSMKKGCSLQILNVSQNEITESGMQIFKQDVVKVELQELDLSKNKILGGGLFQMAYLIGTEYNLTKISKSLKVLKLCHVRNRKNAFTHFCKQLQRNQILQALYIDYFISENESFLSDFALLLRRNWTLRKLSMKKCIQLGYDCKGLLKALAQHRGIEILLLPENHFDVATIKFMFECLRQNKSIKVLDLKSCKISDSDLVQCADSFTKIKVKKLFLDLNLINNVGADILQKMIYRNKEIEELTLRGNCLTEKRIQQLKKVLNYNIEANRTIEPELTHYQLIEQKNQIHKEQLQKHVMQLREKEKSLRYKHLLHFIAKRQTENGFREKEMKVQNEQIGKLSEMTDYLHKMNDYRKKVIEEEKNQDDNNVSAVSVKFKEKPSYLGLSEDSQVVSSIQITEE